MASLPPANSARRNAQRGSTLVEFCLVTAVWIPLLLTFCGIGLDSLRGLISASVCRDAGHMFAYGVDFRLSQNQQLLANLAAPLNMSAGSGDGSLVMSSITLVMDSDCTAAGLSSCPNAGHYAFTSFVQFGSTDPTLMQTRMGTPPASYVTGATAFGNTDFMTNTSLRADGLSTYLSLPSQSGQIVFVSELTMKPQITNVGSSGTYVRSIF